MERNYGLVERIAAGDESALVELIRVYEPTVLKAIARAGVYDENIREDLAQEVWIRIWEHAGTFVDGGRPYPWVHAIARNIALDYLRKSSRRKRLMPVQEICGELSSHDSTETEFKESVASVAEKLRSKKMSDMFVEIANGNMRGDIMETCGIKTDATWRWRMSYLREMLEESPEFSSVFGR